MALAAAAALGAPSGTAESSARRMRAGARDAARTIARRCAGPILTAGSM
jgi:hypothetical protein